MAAPRSVNGFRAVRAGICARARAAAAALK
jgi:hypothetical protein